MRPCQALGQRTQRALELEILADGDELHLRRDDTAPRVVHLRYVASRLGAARLAMQIKAHPAELGVGKPHAAVCRRELRQSHAVAALLDPWRTQRREPGAHID